MEPKKEIRRDPDVIGVFTIPNELAMELSEVITTISIRHSLLLDLIDKPTKYDEVEKNLIQLEERKAALMNSITRDYIPDEYRFDYFTWFFAGYSVAGNECWIKKT